MIRHVAVIKLSPSSTADQRGELVGMIGALRGLPQVRSMTVGESVTEGQADVGMVADFDTADDLATYLTHPRHLEVVAFLGPLRESSMGIDYVVDGHQDGTERLAPSTEGVVAP
ncbi:putative Stress responsive protein [Frankia canadensis]|uniref:Putative Stress responsive protein n=1 Tax=Frankia canadensis TaxID=1836972 RepID=A0A2I2KIB5_9ACTN|nr:Dabb family protein [Frankia canadensis]SNQ45410.1 putative Stress responsive protein [Frankia canadensis]SOU52700.1 putative Stress responsive protein [Frankia canadensis]